MKRKLLVDGLGWGFLLWLVGYILGIVLFMLVPKPMIGWILTPIGVVLTWLVLIKKIKEKSKNYYFYLALIWSLLAIVADYLFIVLLLKTGSAYYKPDVFVYYALTFLLPLEAARYKNK